jgi:hypothetical protein
LAPRIFWGACFFNVGGKFVGLLVMKVFLLNSLLFVLALLTGCSMETQLDKYIDTRSSIKISPDGQGPLTFTPDSERYTRIIRWIYMNADSWKKINNDTYFAYDTIRQDHFSLLFNRNYDWCLINLINDDHKIVKQYSRSVSKYEIDFLIPPLIDRTSCPNQPGDYSPYFYK